MLYRSLTTVAFSVISLFAMAQNDVTRTTYYTEPGSYGTKRESDPPNYVRDLKALGFSGVHQVDWINIGLDTRNRTEYRQNDIRRAPTFSEDVPVLFKSRAYFGFEERFGFLGATAEFQDSRRYNSQFAIDNRDWNPMTFIQAYGELKFKSILPRDPRGNYRPVLIRGGRMTFEFLDRRLIALNQWRNTSNNFLGTRISIGQDANDWQFDLLILHPISRLVDSLETTSDFDTTRTDIWFNAAIGHWRKWSPYITIEPYYMGLRQIAGVENGNVNRNIMAPGLRLSGWLWDKSINYDFATTLQLGVDAGKTKQAHLITAEIGYTFKENKMKPRFSLFYGEATGDKDPNDDTDNRFDRFYGFGRPWSADDYIIPENVMAPAIRFEFQPLKSLGIDGGYTWYYLQSSTDRFNNLLDGSNNRDKTGESGNNIGNGPNLRVRYKPFPCLEIISGYSYFMVGEFVQNMQANANGIYSETSNFFFVETTINIVHLVSMIQKQQSSGASK
ncbi:MAG TPA: alginate export family protein [Chitinophagales bacterium]|nr:alginate export family protein [Chitinophagales bacterium]